MAFPTLATSYNHEILGNEYCSGYADVFGQWNTGFYCPQTGTSRAVYCCGTSVFKYCCTSRPSRPMDRPHSHDDGDASEINALDSTDTLILIAVACGVAAVLILIIVFSCFFCSCCFVYKKRSNVPGLYRMQDSSTTSGLANFHHHHHHNPSSGPVGLQQSVNVPQETMSVRSSYHQQPQLGPPHFSSFAAISGNYPSRPVLGQTSTSPTPQEMTCLENMIESSNGLCGGPHESFIRVRSGSLASSNPSPVEMEWSSGGVTGRTTPTSLFHINNHHSSGIPSNHTSGGGSLLPPPARFASNQNLSMGHNSGIYSSESMIMDKTNPRELLLQKQQNYSGVQYSLVPSHQQNSIQRNNYCTSTLPSCLRRSGGTPSNIGTPGGGVYHPPQASSPPPLSFQQELQPQQPLKSILRNPRNIPASYNNTPTNNYNMYRRGNSEFEFSEALLPQTASSASSYHGTTSYSERPLLNQIESLRTRPFTPELTAGSATNTGGRYGTTTTEYQNDLNRLDKELDLDSLNRLIELDLDSKL